TRAELVAKGLDEDMYTAALMQGTHPEDGGGTGTPFITLGDGNCLLNAVALQYVRAEGRAVRAAVPQLAAKLRLSVVLEGLRHMEAYLSLQEDIFCCWDNYTGDVYDRLTAAGWCVEPDTIDKARVGSRETARLFFVAQLHNIAVKGQWLQQFVLPILATVIQAPIRVFVPYHSVNISFGGWWGHTLFRPLYQAGPSRDPVYAVFTTYSTADYLPTFADAAGLVQQVGMSGLPTLNHFVAMSPDRAVDMNALAVQRFEDRLRSATDTYREAVSVLNVAKQKPDQEDALLRDMNAEVKKAREDLILRERDYNLVRGAYFVPLASSKAAAEAEQEAHAKCRVRRKR
ncbi:unnamed protein product, partial [Ectocarpus sp. 12 AP-2014]